ncbi:MAG: bifunctional riboflavin kinase/FAD synthetase [Magnetovibrionaceae bacterium]
MRIVKNLTDLDAAFKGGAVAIGNFDGVHLGHRAVIHEAGNLARDHGIPWCVLTFEPHPRALFRPDDPPFRLTSPEAKARLIGDLGVDCLIELTFDEAFSSLTAEEFVDQVLVEGLGAAQVVAGYDFVFGKGRKGDCDLLLHRGREKGFGFLAVSAHGDGEVFSSTRVRNHLRDGDARAAATVLGQPFEIEGEVLRGDQRGRQIGFPTANLGLGDYLRPKNGVYAVRAKVSDEPDGTWMAGVANLGRRPTYPTEDVMIEVHLFDVAPDLYERRLRVALMDFIRAEQKFDGLDALKAQIAADADRARALLESF